MVKPHNYEHVYEFLIRWTVRPGVIFLKLEMVKQNVSEILPSLS